MSMRLSLVAASAALVFASAAFAAAPQSKPLSSSQQKMADCSHAAKGKTGADYKNAVSSCMKGDTTAAAAPAKMTPQERMSACSKENAGKKGAEYKSAVSACMKAH
ncbi:PsiF family protein [Dyella choica]|nr:PsiF family protein [Dyella choica]